MMMSAPKARVRYSIRSRGGYCGFSSKTFAVMITLHPLWTTLPPSILMPLESSRYDEPTYRPAIELSVIEDWLDAGAQTSFVGWHITTDINSDCCRVVFERYHSYARISCPMVLNIFIEIFFYSVFLKRLVADGFDRQIGNLPLLQYYSLVPVLRVSLHIWCRKFFWWSPLHI